LWVLPSRWSIPLQRSPSSLSSLWMATWYEWISPCEWRRLQGFSVEDPSGARQRGPNRPPEWAGPAGLGRQAQAHLGPVRSPLRSRGSSCIYALCTFHLHDFDDVTSRPRWRFSVHEVQSFMLQYLGVFLHNTSVLSTIGSDFFRLMNMNKTP
jgi:hypothetical protein